mgnify:CR=1 FL=1
MRWLPFRRAWHNPIFRGGLEAFMRHPTYRAHALNYLLALATVLFVTWPREGFVSLRDLPFTYNALGGWALITLAFVALTQGSHKVLETRALTLHDWLQLAPLRAGTFLRGYLAASLLEMVLLWALSLPLLLLAARVAGEPLSHVSQGMLIILVCVGSYRTVGVTLLTLLERDEFLLYILTRICYVCVILASGFVLPLANPVLAFADASIWPSRLSRWTLYGYPWRGWVATVGLHLLLAGAFYIIAGIRVHWVQRRGAALAASDGGPVDGHTS